MMDFALNSDEHAAASLAALAVNDNGKRTFDDSVDGDEKAHPKLPRLEETALVHVGPARPTQEQKGSQSRPLRPFPYFYYRDFSKQVDPDPLTPLTAPGRVPNFPAKMHSILSRPDLADVVAWMPHGRSWRVLKPREFEVRVIPTYFEHAKFSSFIRQANGWGFRRVTQGRDRNSYYHEMFLRGLPHLCKMMKRPGVSEKQAADPEHEPDFYKITEENPVPEKADDESILLQCTLQGGPKARMPIYFGALSSSPSTTPTLQFGSPSSQSSPFQVAQSVTNSDQLCMSPLHQSMPGPENRAVNSNMVHMDTTTTQPHQMSMAQPTYAPAPAPIAMNSFIPQQQVSVQPAPAPVAETNPAPPTIAPATNPLAMIPTTDDAAAKQFAAGFAAATALSQQQFRAILGQALAAATKAVPPGVPNGQVVVPNNQAGMMNHQAPQFSPQQTAGQS